MRTMSFLLLLLGFSSSAFADEPKKLAVIISAAWGNDTAVHNDLVAMHRALEKRGFRADEMVSLDGKLSRSLVLNFLNSIGNEVAGWQEGQVFLYYTGHGSFKGQTAKNAVVGLQLQSTAQESIEWREVFHALRLPPTVNMILLPDC